MADPLAALDRSGAWGRVRGLPFARRWVLQGEPADIAPLDWPGGLPDRMLMSTASDGHAALSLGPDEWLLIAPADALAPQPGGPASLVEVSHRNLAVEVSGPSARAILNTGNPLDLADTAFAPGTATRTVFGKAEIVLWRPGSDPLWRLELSRSFAPYLCAHLLQAVADQ